MTEGARCGTALHESAHAATIRGMIAAAPPFRPGASAPELVEEFATPANRMPAFLALHERGEEVLPHIRAGLRHPDWQVRRWCALFADTFADAETLRALVPLLGDPKSQVRLWAVHSLACETCKDGPNPVDPIPLLLERIATDESLRVRRQAVAMLAHHLAPDPRVTSVFRTILAEEEDRKLRLHAEEGLKRYGAAATAASGGAPS
ncbi:HEAT repeat domain-containing protein [Candidatus Palauibacter sp.]|uniref:HEAT repeat domain-containing protein n=1 Tax=Candidatus Palauibacter sp. TaxID=3101350 RepID=UPI003B51B953